MAVKLRCKTCELRFYPLPLLHRRCPHTRITLQCCSRHCRGVSERSTMRPGACLSAVAALRVRSGGTCGVRPVWVCAIAPTWHKHALRARSIWAVLTRTGAGLMLGACPPNVVLLRRVGCYACAGEPRATTATRLAVLPVSAQDATHGRLSPPVIAPPVTAPPSVLAAA